MNELGALAVLAQRDVLRFLRDPARILATLVFPVILIAALGGVFQASFGQRVGYNLVVFTFTGVFAQTLFQSTAIGIISLMEDRTNNFSQEMFVSPISRYTIVAGKIAGETAVSLIQGLAIVLIGLLVGVPIGPAQVAGLAVAGVAACLLGGSFGILVLANLRTRSAVEQIFNFLFLPQYFLGGVFTPLVGLPVYLDIASRFSPLRYAVDFTRGLFYAGTEEFSAVVAAPPAFNLAMIGLMFGGFLLVGTTLFARAERNR
ncbi:MAG: ABC transporter permease [Dehalococcoidia bacterium]